MSTPVGPCPLAAYGWGGGVWQESSIITPFAQVCQVHLAGSSVPDWGGSLGDLEEIRDVFLEEGMLDLNFDGWNWKETRCRSLGFSHNGHKVDSAQSKFADLINEPMSSCSPSYPHHHNCSCWIVFIYLNTRPEVHWTVCMVCMIHQQPPKHPLFDSQWQST